MEHIALTPYKEQAHINSLDGAMDEITILEKVLGDPKGTYYIAQHKNIKCTAIFNPFVWAYYADDIYGVIEQ